MKTENAITSLSNKIRKA